MGVFKANYSMLTGQTICIESLLIQRGVLLHVIFRRRKENLLNVSDGDHSET